jgi:hypothetical protein
MKAEMRSPGRSWPRSRAGVPVRRERDLQAIDCLVADPSRGAVVASGTLVEHRTFRRQGPNVRPSKARGVVLVGGLPCRVDAPTDAGADRRACPWEEHAAERHRRRADRRPLPYRRGVSLALDLALGQDTHRLPPLFEQRAHPLGFLRQPGKQRHLRVHIGPYRPRSSLVLATELRSLRHRHHSLTDRAEQGTGAT